MSSVQGDVINAMSANFRSLVSATKETALQQIIRMGSSKSVRAGSLEPPIIMLVKHWLNPAAVVMALLISLMLHLTAPSAADAAMCVITLLLSRQIFRPIELTIAAKGHYGIRSRALLRPIIEYFCVCILLWVLAVALKVTEAFSQEVVLTWLILTPVTLLVVNTLSSQLTRWLGQNSIGARRHIIVGINDIGVELAKRIKASEYLGKFEGYFDHRAPDRLPQEARKELMGHCDDVADYVRRKSINVVYIALPLATTPRIAMLIRELRDTTASVYFVPNIFAFDLVQANCADINGMPVMSICETPLLGMSGIRKRIADVLMSLTALTVLSPVMLAIAIAVRMSSAGPVLFRQKRYGLNGEEILVYKFRTMTVCENGSVVTQATRHDKRITPLGKFLRKSSLDELPQILNVLEGKMSFVGPRPHAVAHNELYRKLISGYMIRHKVRPGITGWAQVNGLRGETSTVDKMEQRVQFDLDYLRNWSLWLDIKIIAKTALMVVHDQNAY